MTQPRFIVPGETVLITVRTNARFYLLRPDPELVEAIKYSNLTRVAPVRGGFGSDGNSGAI